MAGLVEGLVDGKKGDVRKIDVTFPVSTVFEDGLDWLINWPTN
jgi:hypothetical protein